MTLPSHSKCMGQIGILINEHTQMLIKEQVNSSESTYIHNFLIASQITKHISSIMYPSACAEIQTQYFMFN